MAQTQTGDPPSFASARAGSSILSNVVYRSRATSALSGHDLIDLTRAAQARNHAEALTGLVLHDEGHFYQWLEGPDESLSRVMASIANDRRHTDIEILRRGTLRQRMFDGWTMKLAAPGAFAAADVVNPPSHVIEELRRRPEHAVEALAELAPGPRAKGCLESLIRSRVIPEIAARHALRNERLHPRAAELAESLLGDAVEPVEALLEQCAARAGSMLALRLCLIEPAARGLGDFWLADTCTETDVIVGLYRLQSAMRRVARTGLSDRSPGKVLVATVPGETHLLGAALASDTLHAAGWGVSVAFPADIEALVAPLRSKRFRALHLSLSDALRREEFVPLLRQAVRSARSADRGLRVTVGGRIFAEGNLRPADVGADATLPG